jgi:uncharacterized protein YecE (DUF72 family)
MVDPILIGTRGWNPASGGDFYPSELPDDWRFCYYSNNLRSVLVPQETWDAVQRSDVAQWLEDSDPAFRFVVELPATLGLPLTQHKREQALAQFLETLEPVAPRTAGLLLRIAPDTAVLPDWFEHFLNRLANVAPLCVDLPVGSWRVPMVYAALERQGAGLAWHCAREPAPHPGGRLMVAHAPTAPARELRHWLGQLVLWQGQSGLAGLFFESDAAKAAQEARLIAELMGI